jgi:hypothetical protein
MGMCGYCGEGMIDFSMGVSMSRRAVSVALLYYCLRLLYPAKISVHHYLGIRTKLPVHSSSTDGPPEAEKCARGGRGIQ